MTSRRLFASIYYIFNLYENFWIEKSLFRISYFLDNKSFEINILAPKPQISIKITL